MTKRDYIKRDGTSNTKEYAKNWVKGWRDRKRLFAIKAIMKIINGGTKKINAILKNIK